MTSKVNVSTDIDSILNQNDGGRFRNKWCYEILHLENIADIFRGDHNILKSTILHGLKAKFSYQLDSRLGNY